MASAQWVLVFVFFSLASAFRDLSSAVEEKRNTEEVGFLNRRALLGFKEMPKGGNISFDCSPSGPCVPCAYSEKTSENYRCSETGYRIPLKCVEAEATHSKEADNSKKAPKDRSTLQNTVNEVKIEANASPPKEISKRGLLDDPPTEGRQPYITYRSCIPAVNEEKLSVLGFEGVMVGFLLMSGSAIYYRRKKTNVLSSGHVRVSDNSRF